MEVAKLRCMLDEHTDVPLAGVTPAEAQVLVSMHEKHAKKHPIVDLEITGRAASIDVPASVDDDGKPVPAKLRDRSGKEEVARLRTKYQKKVIDALFPGENPNVPDTFKAAFPPKAASAKQENVANVTTVEELPLLVKPVEAKK